ncbi:MAG TPA: UMP kinase [Alphaproteobacteria bacterium]|nr:UMP kinase [Alphaproteobacteria bacterium]
MKFKRILLKLSGEALMGDQHYGLDMPTVKRICKDIADVVDTGAEVSIVVGAGNLFRGMKAAEAGMERAGADYMGMLATVMNSLALQNVLEGMGKYTRVLSAIPMDTVCEAFIRRRAIRHMEKGRIVICAAGTGNPYFTTDTAAALRAMELECDALFKGTQVDGVYDSDPKKNKTAKHYKELTYKKVLEDDLKVMDGAAIAIARENKLPIVVFDLHEEGSFKKAINGKGKSTIIR